MFLGLPEFGRVSSGFALGEPVQASSCFNSYEKKVPPPIVWRGMGGVGLLR
jgi:hypothetical protein